MTDHIYHATTDDFHLTILTNCSPTTNQALPARIELASQASEARTLSVELRELIGIIPDTDKF